MNRFSRYAWAVVGYNLLVILWGGYVRASGSGAGCGSHWPLCNGEVVPRTPTMATIIEFSHRLTSGLALILVVVLAIQAFRHYERRHPVRLFAGLSVFFMLTEALVGAGLVLFEYVAMNKSVARAWWMGAHLLNTFILVACMAITAWSATTGERLILAEQGRLKLLCLLTILATLLLGVSGAISALGATLFPVTSVAEGLRQDLSPTAHILVRLRIYHPIIASVVSTLMIVTAVAVRLWRPGRRTLLFSRVLIALVTIQFAVGLVNLLLHAPISLQIIHLLLSDLIWIVLILLIYTGFSTAVLRDGATTGTPVSERS